MKICNKKESVLMKIINAILLVITFGKQKKFMTDFVTTIGEIIYVPESWDSYPYQDKQTVLHHEQVHVNQYKKEKFLYMFKYLFWPLPIFFAHARLTYEIEAFAADIVYSYRNFGVPPFGPRFAHVIENLTGPAYFWTWKDKKYVRVKLTAQIFKEIQKTKV